MRRCAFVSTFVAAALTLGPIASAHAGDLDGLWARDDGKVYRIAESDGIVEGGGGDLGCRLHWTRDDDGHVLLKLRFTRVTDEQGWLATTAVSESTDVDATTAKIDLAFDWADLDAKGKVVARGTESHTLTRKKKLSDAELASTAARLAWHARIDAYLVAGSPELDLDAALDAATQALADEACGKDPVLLERHKALAAACARGSRASSPASSPAKVAFVSLDAHHSPAGSDQDKGDFAEGHVRARITNLTTRPLESVTVEVRPLGDDGKDCAESQGATFSLTPPLAPGASVEETCEVSSPEVRNARKLALDVTGVTLADGLVWEPFDPPLTVKALASDPIEVEYLGLVASTAREIKENAPSQLGAFRLRNASPASIESYAMWIHFLAADGKEIDKTGSTACRNKPLRPGAFCFTKLAKALPVGTKRVVVELTDVGFTNKREWRSGKGLVSPE